MPIIDGTSVLPDLNGSAPPSPTPDQPVDPDQWPWPFNLLQNFLQGAFSWVVDIIKYWIDKLGGDITTFFHDIDEGLTASGDWLKTQIDSAISSSQSFLGQIIKENQNILQKSITDTQGILKEATEAGIGGLEAIIKGTTKVLDDGIKGVQAEINLQVSTIQNSLQEAVDPDRGIIPTLIREIPEAIFTLANTTIGPVLKGLNDVLEEV